MNFLQLNKNKKILADGLAFLKELPNDSMAVSIFDPQYRAGLDYLDYGNEGESRMKGRAELSQMSDDLICLFLNEIARVLKPSGYLFLWVDKFILGEGLHKSRWFERNSVRVGSGVTEELIFLENLSSVKLVDLLIWDKGRIGMGARTRRKFETLLIYQKKPYLAKATWGDKGIPDCVEEKVENPRSGHPHKKPPKLTKRLIEGVTKPGDYIVDPCAGSFSTLDVCLETGRNFIGCDISNAYASEKVRLP